MITVSLIVVQEMAARMGAVTGKGLAELVREQYGVRWSTFSMVSVLIANLGICISEFVGIGAALSLAHVPKYVSVPIAAAVVWLLLVGGSYKVAERIFVLMTIPFFAYPIAAILAHPDWGSVGQAVVAPHVHANSAYLLLFIATAGTTITPFMQLYVQSAVVERGIGPDELNAERAEVVDGLDLRQPRRLLHHHRDRRDAVRPRRPHDQQRGGRGEGARPVRRPLRRGAVRGRPARRLAARGGDPAGHGRLRDRGDVRVREGHLAPAARGARLRRRDHGADRDRDGRRAASRACR